jgi:hypothetical protein
MNSGKNIILLIIGASLLLIGLANAQQTSQPTASEKQMGQKMSQPMTNEKQMGQTMPHSMLKPMPDSLRMQRHIQMLQDSLGLTTDQTSQIKTIMENEEKQMMVDHEKYASDTKALQKARTELHSSTQTAIKGVLNKDQQKKYDQMQGDMRNKEKMHWGDHSKTKNQYEHK